MQAGAPELGEQNDSASILRLSPSREIIAYLNNGLHRLNLALYQCLIGHNFWSCSLVPFFLSFFKYMTFSHLFLGALCQGTG